MFQIRNDPFETKNDDDMNVNDVTNANADTNVKANADIDNFFARFDERSGAVTKSALKTIKRIGNKTATFDI